MPRRVVEMGSKILLFFNFSILPSRLAESLIFTRVLIAIVTDFVIPRKETLVATLSKTACLALLAHTYNTHIQDIGINRKSGNVTYFNSMALSN